MVSTPHLPPEYAQERAALDLLHTYFFDAITNGTPEDWEREQEYFVYDHDTGKIDVTLGDIEAKQAMPDGMLPVSFESIRGGLNLDHADLTTLEGCPAEVGAWFECGTGNPRLTSLRHMPVKVYGWVEVPWSPDMAMLHLVMVQGISRIKIVRQQAHLDAEISRMRELEKILWRYQGQGRAGIMPCAAELHKAGFGGNARL